MSKNKLALFFSFFLISSILFSQAVEEIVQIDTVTEVIEVVYLNSEASTYYTKKVATFKGNPSQIAIEKSYTPNGQNGIYKVYYPSGKLKIKTVYANDKINGEWTLYNPEGIILIKGVYKNGVKHGYWAYKSLKTYGKYKNGKKQGKWYKQDVNEKKKRAFYKKGVLVKGEGFGNENVVIVNDTAKGTSTNDIVATENSAPISKEYQQAIDFLKTNLVFRKKLKEYFGQEGVKEVLEVKKHFKKGEFKFALSPNIINLNLNSFIKESEEGKIVVAVIDSILKNDRENLKQQFLDQLIEENQLLHNASTDLASSIVIFFSEVKNGLLRIDVVLNHNDKEQKFKTLLYFNKDGVLKGAEYQKLQ